MKHDFLTGIEALLENNQCMKALELFRNDIKINQADNDDTSRSMRFWVNQFFNKLLLREAKSTVEERRCLIPDGNDNEWLELFEKKVVNKLQ